MSLIHDDFGLNDPARCLTLQCATSVCIDPSWEVCRNFPRLSDLL